MNKNENATNKNLWCASKTVFRGKFIAVNAYIKKKKDGNSQWKWGSNESHTHAQQEEA